MTIYEETFGRFSPFSIGFDRLFQQLQAQSVVNQQNYPPYNIVKVDDENFVIELAIAGFDKKEVNVELEKNVLKIEGKSKENDKDFIHKGLASRSFERVFTLADDVEVSGGKLENGVLKVELKRVIPEEDKPIKIKIS
jgi:molecular chaperone IbpA